MSGPRKHVFISASPYDRTWVERLEIMLAPSLQQEQISIWTTDKILPGTVWQEAHASAIATTKVAVLLVTANLLASELIMHDELPRFIQAAQAGELTLLWIAVGASMYKITPLARYKPLNDPDRPLNSLSSFQLDKVLVSICEKIVQAATSSPLAKPSSPFSQPGGSFSANSSLQSARPDSMLVKTDVLLVTAVEVETRAVLDLLPQQRLFHGRNLSYHLLDEIAGAKICLVQSNMGQGGPSGAVLTVNEAIDTFKPSSVIMVGIAFGAKEGEQEMGDILVSKQIADYEIERVGDPQRISRSDRPSASPRLLGRFNAAFYTWSAPPKVHFGLFLSGAKVLDNEQFRKELIERWPDAIGGDMEGFGLYAAAQREKVDWIVVKAICDWGYRKKGGERAHQQIAAANAAKFVQHVLNNGGFI